MDGADPSFSVVIPLYDKREHIARALDSVLAQTHAAFEVIVIDDGSTDGGGAVAAAHPDSRVRLISQANAGAGPARNVGAAAARGDWIALLDADDLWRAAHLETLAGVIRAFPESTVVAAGSQSILLPQLADALMVEPPSGTNRRLDFFRDYAPHVLHSSTIAIARTAFAATTGFGAHPAGEDMEFWIRLALDHRFAVSTRPTGLYVRGTDGIMEQQHAAMVAGAAFEGSPVFATLEAALRNPAYAARRGAIAAFTSRKRLQYARSLLYHGRSRDAWRMLTGTGARGLPYRLLALVPGRVVRAAAARYSAMKRAWR